MSIESSNIHHSMKVARIATEQPDNLRNLSVEERKLVKIMLENLLLPADLQNKSVTRAQADEILSKLKKEPQMREPSRMRNIKNALARTTTQQLSELATAGLSHHAFIRKGK